jgi:hypothetical protein
MEEPGLPLPRIRCLTKEQAADYLGIGVTLLADLDVPCVKFGRRCVYDVVDLDSWLEEYKRRGRARRETLWPVKPGSTGDETLVTGGSILHYPTASAYAEALKPRRGKKPKPSLRS